MEEDSADEIQKKTKKELVKEKLRKQFELFLDVIIEEQRKKVNRRTNTHI
jgi:hypothetical protein